MLENIWHIVSPHKCCLVLLPPPPSAHSDQDIYKNSVSFKRMYRHPHFIAKILFRKPRM